MGGMPLEREGDDALAAEAATCFFMCALSIDFWVKVALHS
jgi:hypothetical protein